jgi:hypothetical protein
MVIEFKYCGLDVKLRLVESPDTEVNPVPIMDALIKMFKSISYYRDFDLVITSKGNEHDN